MYLLPNETKTKRHNEIVEQITNFASKWIWYDKSVHFDIVFFNFMWAYWRTLSLFQEKLYQKLAHTSSRLSVGL